MKSCKVKRAFWINILGAVIVFSAPRGTLFAQDISLVFNHLPLEKASPDNTSYFVSQDTFGFIWIGTDEGLYRFDGLTLTPILLSGPGTPDTRISTEVTSRCFEDRAKNLWFSTASALMCYQRSTGRVRMIPNSTLQKVIAFHLDPQDRLWFKANSGAGQGALYCFNIPDSSFERYCPIKGERFTVLTDQKTGEVLKVVATILPNKPGLIETDVKTCTSHPVEFIRPNGKPFKQKHPTLNAWIDGDSIVWVGIYNGIGKYYLKKPGNAVAIITPRDIGWIDGIVPYDEHRLLAASELSGLLVFDKASEQFVQQFRPRPGLPGALPQDRTAGLYRDASGNIWLTVPGSGIDFAHLRKSKFSYPPETAGILVSSLFEDRNGQIWCGSRDSGVYVFAPDGALKKRITRLHNPGNPTSMTSLPSISCMWEDQQQRIWGLYENNALPFNETLQKFEFLDTNQFGPHYLPSDLLRANYQLANGTRLIAQGKEIFELKTSGKIASLKPWIDLKSLGLQQVTGIFQSSKGNLYLADNPDRILVLTLDSTLKQVQKIVNVSNAGNCTAFAETPDGSVWAAGSKGLVRIKPDSNGRLLNEKTDGIPNERYYDILPDNKGHLWLTGPNGLIRFDPTGPTGNRFHRFGTPDGLFSNAFSPNATLRISTTGDFWVGGKNGINVFRPEAIRLLDDQPKVQFTGLMVNDTPFIADRDLCILDFLELGPDENTLTFLFAALDFSAPGQNQYYCRMHGVDRDTVSIGNRGFVRYANIPPGHYTFEVWATNSDGLWCAESRRLKLYIRPPFYQQWWFYLLCALAAAGLLYAWFQYRLRQALKIERLRVQISSDLHDDVGALLSGLAMQSELLERTAREQDKNILKRLSAVSRDAMARMRDTVWAIDARRDKLEDLIDRLREHAEETLSPKGIRFHIQVDQLRPQQNLPTLIRQQLFLIGKEALTNAAKHSNGDTVQITLKKSGKGLELRICDNGTAPEKAYKATGLGLSNMQLRAEKIGGVLEITRDEGFCITLRLYAIN